MPISVSNPPTWEDIELAESYLVQHNFEDSSLHASSIMRHLIEKISTKSSEDPELEEMINSTAMVLIQSLKELGRTSEMFNELINLFGSVSAIPVEIFLAGACFMISEGCSAALQSCFEDFIGKCEYVATKSSYIITEKSPKGWRDHVHISMEVYLQLAEVYAITLLGTVLRDANGAISWVEKANLPEEKRQEMLRRLYSLYSQKSASADPGQAVEGSGKERVPCSVSSMHGAEKCSRLLETRGLANGDNSKTTVLKSKVSKPVLRDTQMGWFRTILSKLRGFHPIIPNGRMLLWGPLIILIYYVIRRKGSVLKRVLSEQVLSVRKATVDFWQLAFSVQVNPLAAVQPPALPVGGSR